MRLKPHATDFRVSVDLVHYFSNEKEEEFYDSTFTYLKKWDFRRSLCSGPECR